MMSEDSEYYQVDFSVLNLGRLVPRSKKRITWNFRHGDKVHEVSLVWSKRTGKQHIYMNDTEVWFGRRQGASICSHRWATRREDQMNIHVLAVRATPKGKVSNNFRKYDLMIDDQVFARLLRDQDGSKPETPPGEDGPSCIMEVLFPKGYKWSEVIDAVGL
jgi:hypothetical protein